MFYKDKNGIDTIQLGTGDVMVVDITLENTPFNECAGIAFAECDSGKIGRDIEGTANKMDYEIGVKLKLLFTNSTSIDIVMAKLKKAKKLLSPAILGDNKGD